MSKAYNSRNLYSVNDSLYNIRNEKEGFNYNGGINAHVTDRKTKIVEYGNSFYEVDLECVKKKHSAKNM